MGVIDWAFSKIGSWISGASKWDIAQMGLAALIALTAFGIVMFWWFLLHKIFNHGGDH